VKRFEFAAFRPGSIEPASIGARLYSHMHKLHESLKTVGVAHPGTQHSWQTAIGFQESGRLRWYTTSSYYKPNQWPDRLVQLLPTKLRGNIERQLRRRRNDLLDDSLVRRNLGTEPIERFLRLRVSRLLADRLMNRRQYAFPHKVISLMIREPVDAIWGPVDCLEVFEWAKPRNITCILDQPIGHFKSLNRIMLDELSKNPEFFLGNTRTLPDKQLERQYRAAEIADLVVVGSEFAAATMVENGTDPDKIRVVPYGYNEEDFLGPKPIRPPFDGRPIEFLFVGSVGARKGIAYLLKAFSTIDPTKARLTLIGPLEIPMSTFEKYSRGITYLGQVRRSEVATKMRNSDCFILPSLFEGSALVLYEAIAAGLAIVHTKQCGFDVKDGLNGKVLRDVNEETIKETVYEIIHNPQRLQEWRDTSWTTRHLHSWSHYRKAVTQLVC